MTKEPQTIQEFNQKRKHRSFMIAFIVIALVVFVFAVTLIRGPALIAERPSYGIGGPTLTEDSVAPAMGNYE